MQLPSRVGRYRLLRPIGRGGMGEIHLGVLEAPGGVRSFAAIKLVLDARPSQQKALLAEARLAALIAHPNVVHLLDAGIEGELAWFAMEYVRGCSLAELFEPVGNRIPPWVAARIVADACAALHAVHEARDTSGEPLNIVHRDVSPQNLLVSHDGFVKLVDFGIARSSLQSAPTTTGIVKGKLGYLSPEQAAGAAVDRRGDVFALGVVLWEALSGHRLFKGATDAETLAAILRGNARPLRDAAADTPAPLIRVVERALAKEPSARFRTALDMQRALEAALAGAGTLVGAAEVAGTLSALAPASAKPRYASLDAEASTPESRGSSAESGASRPGQALGGRARRGAKYASIALTLFVIGWAAIARTAAQQTTATRHAKPTTSTTSTTSTTGEAAAVVSSGPPETAKRSAMTPDATPVAAEPIVKSSASRGQRPPRAGLPLRSRTTEGASELLPRAEVGSPSAGANRLGTLNVVARPKWAAISIDGKPVGSTPLVARAIGAGSHTIEALPLGNGPSVKKTIVVSGEGVQRVEFVFD